MNQNLTDITIVLDSSGSMQSVAKDTIGGFNKFVETQKAASGDANLSLVQFDSTVKVSYSARNLTEVSRTYSPNGYTALLDAIGMSITSAGKRFADMKEEDRPGKVIFVIMTDGEENSSREYSREKINEMIKHQTEAYQWDFIFIGANQDAIQAGGSLGIRAGNSMNYSADALATSNVFDSVGKQMSNYRSMSLCAKTAFSADADASFFDQSDRDAAVTK